jgi:CRISPR-associated protein Cmr6
VTACPLPPRIAELLAGPETSRSLRFDKGVDTYGGDWKFGSDGKRKFLASFAKLDDDDLAPFYNRRHRALTEGAGARAVELVTQTRLVVGLGLPQPVETGFLLDRLTGCPYLPGSSVKGLLRAAARRVAASELTLAGDPGDDATFFADHLDRLFGPALGGDLDAAKGQVAFYDAFPRTWPRLEVDVLTPHQGDYYVGDGTTVPGDWHDPVPVPFLTVPPGTRFTFYLRSRGSATVDGDLARLERLLRGALDELGIGGKTGAGYGFFGEKTPPRPREVGAAARSPAGSHTSHRPAAREQRPTPAPAPKVAETLWKNQTLELLQGVPTVSRGKQQAKGRLQDLVPDLQQALRAGKKLRADARVVKGIGGEWRIASVESWTLG